ncbi:MAG: hypothetical protein COX34_00730 [Candidatus Nealsonbacteria bacterium CG23_combo_of_CG06-09_8_20_14_all_36_12]|uniref:VanZ-like domain-containing protein n=2 Tax=Candidatus Nealsoniibacteriota TaxID=1817911 RepID=A0A2H0TKU6_9BACT|nr:MAG: hypothetical protein COX34_00730 [Candidatus Nealsonbacteria bacterium CG23_combo_of_CG06-09_8_20_14_all_36_12]PIR72768.1 MAG: hypothetical protein COV26_02180 [Candidatus Nealsonbacteria bacterium CG10_big_fil_rev_8_21_14_0_10_36_23]
MSRIQFKILFPIIIFLIFIFHLFGYLKGLYYSLSFYDDILHFSAGITLSAAIIYILFHTKISRIFKIENKFTNLILVFIATVIIGAFWELLEFFWDLYFAKMFGLPPLQLNLQDTMFDLIWDSIGAFLVIGIYYALFFKKN